MRIHHESAGVADRGVLLLGGSLGTTLEMWEPQLPGLSALLRVIRYDHRGHGRSPVPQGPYAIEDLGQDVIALLDRLEIERVSYCGLSLGGMVGMWLAANAPERIDCLVLICTSADLGGPAYAERAQRVRAAGSTAIVADAVLERWFTPTWAAAHPEQVRRHHQMILSTAAEGYAGCCEAIATLNLQTDLTSITVPTLVIAGQDDQATPPSHGQAIADAIPGARLEVVQGAAHLASVQRPHLVARLIAEHVSREPAHPCE